MIKNSYLHEIYASRAIIKSLVYSKLFGNYKNTALGFGWHFVTPIILICVYYFIFTEIRLDSLPDFWIYLISGIFTLFFLTNNLTEGSGAILSRSQMIKKMYFPREIIVIAQVISSLIIMLIGYSIVIFLMLVTSHTIDPILLLLLIPFFIALSLFALGFVLMLSSITVYFKDLQYFLSSTVIVFYFITPMYFTTAEISSKLSTVVWINPFTYYVEYMHDVLYYGIVPGIEILAVCFILPMFMLPVGYLIFRILKRGFAERL